MNDDNIFAPGDDRPPSMGDADTPLDHQALFQRTWDLMFANIGELAPVLAALFVLNLVSVGVGMATGVWQTVDEDMIFVASGINYGASFVVTFIQLFFQLGLIRMMLALDRGEEASTEMLFEQSANYGRGALALIGLMVAIMVGMMLCIVPGIYLSVALAYVLVLVVDTDLAVPDIFGAAWELTDGQRMFIFVQAILLAVVSFVAYCVTCGLAIPLMVGFYVGLQVVTYNAIRRLKA